MATENSELCIGCKCFNFCELTSNEIEYYDKHSRPPIIPPLVQGEGTCGIDPRGNIIMKGSLCPFPDEKQENPNA